MKRTFLAASLILLAAPAFAGSVRGEYVEARTAEVFAGGCVMSSQAETMGKTAVLAWHVTQGVYDGQKLDGLSVVAAVAGDRNLGIREIGGEAPSYVRAVVYVDQRATPAERRALVKMAGELSRGLISEIVEVKAAPVTFDSSAHAVAGHRRRRIAVGHETHAPRPELRRDEVVHAVHAARVSDDGHHRGVELQRPRAGHPVERSAQALVVLRRLLADAARRRHQLTRRLR